jgi:hypothetical protein
MKHALALAVILVFLCVSRCDAQVKFQPFISTGVTTAWQTDVHSAVESGGVAVIVPVSKKFFLRPVVSAGRVIPFSAVNPFPVVQAGGLLGYHTTKRLSLLGGYLETIQLPASGTLYLPTAVVSTATRIHGRWGVYTPVTFNQKAWGASLQIGYTWP